ncbi:MAG: proton-conducting transporter membrane subunit [Kiritimatiellia bacterium]
MTLNYIFLVPVLAVGLAAALHATAYLHGEARSHLPRFWCFFLATLAAMAGVTFAPDKLTFLLAWEAMGLASAGLVAFENRAKPVRKATWIYLLACHAGACALMLAGVLLEDPNTFLAAFFCAIAGFGLKIGFPPFHVWLPEAHPAAPAPASAVMSGAMIPLGFYGLLRFFAPAMQIVPYNPTCGWTLLALGLAGAFGGILFALPQVNLKKLLAFSSVENMGVVAIGFGLSTLAGLSADGNPHGEIAALAYTGAVAHVLNHAFLKGALFLGAGSVLRQTGTLDQDRLGGLLKRMPVTGTLFTLNALGLAGLPPLNGFLGELLICMAAFKAVQSGGPVLVAAGFLVLIGLALTGGLAAAAYCKAIGATFLGEPRSDAAAQAVETPKRMWFAQLALFTLSLAMIPGTIHLARLHACPGAVDVLTHTARCGVLLVALAALFALLRRRLPRGREKPSLPTWDCGYHAPTARMAYTGTAFTQPLADLFAFLLKPRTHLIPFRGHPAAPTDAAFATETDDRALAGFWRPLFTCCAHVFQRAHLLQSGSLHLYILLILLTVVVLLIAAFAL